MIMKFVAALVALCAMPALATDLTFPDRGRAAVVDDAHVIPVGAAAALNARVVAWDRATGHQLTIVTLPSLQGREIADYGYQLGRAWGLGRKGINDGVILIIAPTEHRVRIEVGRGLEGDLTDAATSVILHDTVVPKLKAVDIAGAASDGADAIMAAVPASAGDMANAVKPSGSSGWALVAVIAGIVGGIGGIVWWARRRKSTPTAAPYRRYHTGGYQPIYSGGAGIPPSGGSGASYEPRRSTTIIAPVIINNSPSYDSSPSYSAPSTDYGSSSYDSGSSGFDSGGGDFGGGGSDSSW